MLCLVVLSRSLFIAPLIFNAAPRSHFENISRFMTCWMIVNGSAPTFESAKSSSISRSYCWISWTRQFATLKI